MVRLVAAATADALMRQWVGKVEEEDCLQHAYVVFIIALGLWMQTPA